jgi:TrmH family RNA methyltransferase
LSSVTAPLTRAQSARIRELLRDKRARNAQGAFIIEGAKPVYDALLHHPNNVLSVVVATAYERAESRQQRHLRVSRNISSFRCSDRVFSALTSLESPQGILAVVRQPSWNEDTLLRQPRLLGLYGEQLQDPANVGAIVRTAAALNIDALWLSPESADIYHPKVVRASAGAVLSLPIFIVDDVATLVRQGIALFAAEAATDRQTIQMDTIRRIPPRLILAVGNESRGLSGHTIKQASCRFTIPLNRHIDSLNVAATAAIVLYYVRRVPVEP